MAAPSTDYTSREEDAIKDEMVRRKPFTTPEWTDDNASDLGNALLDEFAAAISVLHYYVDRAANEAFVGDEKIGCIKRESLEKLFFFWNIPAANPATAVLKFSIVNSFKQDVLIPALTQCQTQSSASPIYFETDISATLKYELLTADTIGTDIINCNSSGFVEGQLVEIGDDDTALIQRIIKSIPGGSQIQLDSVVPVGFTVSQNAYVSALTIMVDATEGKSTSEQMNNSDGSQFQQMRTTSQKIIDNTITLLINEGSGEVVWNPVATFYQSGPSDLHFIWHRKWDDTLAITLGDGAQGKVPVSSSTIRAAFREGGGVIGNVGHSTIKQINSQILVGGSPANLTVTNPLKAEGGSDRMSLIEAKIRGPEILKTNDRYISTNDYIAGAKSISGVGNANAVRVTSPGATYNVAVYIIPTGGGLPSSTLKAAVKAELLSKGSIRVVPEVFDPGLARIDIGGVVHVFPNFIQASVQTAVSLALADFFSVTNQEFGKSVRESDVVRVIDEVDGVDYVDITKLTLLVKGSDVSLDRWTGNAVFGDIAVAGNVVKETWTITFLSANTFNVRGSVTGLQTNIGVLNSSYSSDNGQVTFTIASGLTPMLAGDHASFRTADYRGNVDVLEDEIGILERNTLSYTGGG